VDVKLFHEIKEARGNQALQEVTIVHNRTKEESTLPVDYLILSLGFHADLGPVKQWGIETEGNSIKVNTKMETSVPGVYAAGDVVTYPGKVKLISTGTGEAVTAVCNAKVFIDPKARVFPGHSSELVKE